MVKKIKSKKKNKPTVSGLQPGAGKWILLSIQDSNHKVVGQLDLVGKVVTFRSNANKAARAFFDSTKGFIDSYILERLTERPPAEEELITLDTDSSLFTKALKKLNLKPEQVLSHTEYPNRLVIVTKDGKKLIVPI